MHSSACAVARQYAAHSNRRYHCVPPGGDGLRWWENQRTLSSVVLGSVFFIPSQEIGLGNVSKVTYFVLSGTVGRKILTSNQ